MSNTVAPGSDPAMEAAIARVLAAERDARAAIEDCQAEAAQVVAAARVAALRVATRADGRTRAEHAAFQRKVETDIAAIDAEIAALDASAPEAQALPDDGEAFAVAALAAELTAGKVSAPTPGRAPGRHGE
ncbi:MAG: hypothetical protein HY778_14255 [Betaproteobacteria bacterium]|nr:hypothetical protein [Betaproteobacteria bacterium]